MIKKLLFLLLMLSYVATNAQDNYLDFDGTDDNVVATGTDNLLANSNAITMACKVYPRRVSTGFPNFNGFMGYRNETNFDFYLIQLSSTDMEARFRNSSGTAYSITYTGLILNQWTQFFLVYNGAAGTLKLYANATEVASVPASGSAPASSTGPLKIGLITYQAFNWYHNGKVDEASLWNKALSAAEISAIVSNNGEIANPGGETNLKLYYKLNQGIPYGTNTGLTTVNDELSISNGTALNFSLTGNSSNWGSDTLGATQFNTNVVKVYPNPASNTINISGLAQSTSVKIIDISGRIVSSAMLSGTESSIDISNLHTGIYFIQGEDGNQTKFIKN